MEWLGGILLGAIISYVLDFTKPWVTAFFTKGSLSYKEKRLSGLIKEYEKIQRFTQDKFLLIIYLMRRLVLLVITGIYTVIVAGTLLIDNIYLHNISEGLGTNGWYTLNIIANTSVFYALLTFNKAVRSVYAPRKYKEKTVAKLIKLGGNPLDIEIIAIESQLDRIKRETARRLMKAEDLEMLKDSLRRDKASGKTSSDVLESRGG
jgi:hypothetical protein